MRTNDGTETGTGPNYVNANAPGAQGMQGMQGAPGVQGVLNMPDMQGAQGMQGAPNVPNVPGMRGAQGAPQSQPQIQSPMWQGQRQPWSQQQQPWSSPQQPQQQQQWQQPPQQQSQALAWIRDASWPWITANTEPIETHERERKGGNGCMVVVLGVLLAIFAVAGDVSAVVGIADLWQPLNGDGSSMVFAPEHADWGNIIAGVVFGLLGTVGLVVMAVRMAMHRRAVAKRADAGCAGAVPTPGATSVSGASAGAAPSVPVSAPAVPYAGMVGFRGRWLEDAVGTADDEWVIVPDWYWHDDDDGPIGDPKTTPNDCGFSWGLGIVVFPAPGGAPSAGGASPVQGVSGSGYSPSAGAASLTFAFPVRASHAVWLEVWNAPAQQVGRCVPPREEWTWEGAWRLMQRVQFGLNGPVQPSPAPPAPEFRDVVQVTMEADVAHSRARVIGMRALDPETVRIWHRRSFEALASGCSVPEEPNLSGVLVVGVSARSVVPTDTPFSVR